MVVYLNVVQSLKLILRTLAASNDINDESNVNVLELDSNDSSSATIRSLNEYNSKATTVTSLSSAPTASTSGTSTSPLLLASLFHGCKPQSSRHQTADLCLRISSLLAMEEQLATRLAGGLLLEEDVLLNNVANTLEVAKDDIKALWMHPTVVALIENMKLKLDEGSES